MHFVKIFMIFLTNFHYFSCYAIFGSRSILEKGKINIKENESFMFSFFIKNMKKNM